MRIPRFGIVILNQMAQREGSTIDAVLAKQLISIAIDEMSTMRDSAKELDAAMRWPMP